LSAAPDAADPASLCRCVDQRFTQLSRRPRRRGRPPRASRSRRLAVADSRWAAGAGVRPGLVG
jgi:hypothetical protein